MYCIKFYHVLHRILDDLYQRHWGFMTWFSTLSRIREMPHQDDKLKWPSGLFILHKDSVPSIIYECVKKWIPQEEPSNKTKNILESKNIVNGPNTFLHSPRCDRTDSNPNIFSLRECFINTFFCALISTYLNRGPR